MSEERPWGSFEVLDENIKMKRIKVKAGHRLSLQSHNHRDEYWIWQSGLAKVTVGDKELILNPMNKAILIQKEVKHRVEALTDVEFLEFQVGDILEEEDIIRYEDDYGRVENSL